MRYRLRLIISLLILLIFNHLNGQSKTSVSFLDKLKDEDLSHVIIPDSISNDSNQKFENLDPLGYIGTEFQRFQIHFNSIEKSKSNPYEYEIAGKTKVKDNICNFTGTILISTALYDTSTYMKDIGFPKCKAGQISGQVLIKEDINQPSSGFIRGNLTTDIYINEKGKIHYDALMFGADGFYNNQFSGNWTSYKSGITKKCNWGDCRIPDSKELDGGTGMFYPEKKYLDYGWRSYYNFLTGPVNDAKRKEAERIENEWWK